MSTDNKRQIIFNENNQFISTKPFNMSYKLN